MGKGLIWGNNDSSLKVILKLGLPMILERWGTFKEDYKYIYEGGGNGINIMSYVTTISSSL